MVSPSTITHYPSLVIYLSQLLTGPPDTTSELCCPVPLAFSFRGAGKAPLGLWPHSSLPPEPAGRSLLLQLSGNVQEKNPLRKSALWTAYTSREDELVGVFRGTFTVLFSGSSVSNIRPGRCREHHPSTPPPGDQMPRTSYGTGRGACSSVDCQRAFCANLI